MRGERRTGGGSADSRRLPAPAAEARADYDREYDPEWPDLFERERDRIRGAAGLALAAIEHVGSTAVPGMAGKPIVDLLVGVERLEVAGELARTLETLGYRNFGEIFFPGRLYLRRRGAGSFNAAVAERSGPFWAAQLAVRDYLRAHSEEAAAYARTKRSVYAAGAKRFSTYSQEKAGAVARLLEQSRKWSATREAARGAP